MLLYCSSKFSMAVLCCPLYSAMKIAQSVGCINPLASYLILSTQSVYVKINSKISKQKLLTYLRTSV